MSLLCMVLCASLVLRLLSPSLPLCVLREEGRRVGREGGVGGGTPTDESPLAKSVRVAYSLE